MADDDKSIIPIFFIDAVHMSYRSEQEGRPIYEDREFIKILIAGDRNSEIVREVSEGDKERFRDAYRKFKEGLKDTEQLVGTPVRQWSAMRPSDVKMLEGLNLYTVENVAGMSDTAIQNFGMGGLELRAKAQAYLETAKDGAAASAFAAENERMKAEMEELRRQIRDLASQITEEKRGPGRPRKDAA